MSLNDQERLALHHIDSTTKAPSSLEAVYGACPADGCWHEMEVRYRVWIKRNQDRSTFSVHGAKM